MRVKVICIDRTDESRGIKVGDVYNVVRQDRDGDYYVDKRVGSNPTALLGKYQVEVVPEYINWVRPKADNNIVNSAVRILAKVYTHVSNVAVKVLKFLRGK